MDKFYDFMSAALPWIAMGLLLAIFFARTANGTKKEEDHGSEGMALGMCFGVPCQRRCTSTSALA